jgi:hypothetical protein
MRVAAIVDCLISCRVRWFGEIKGNALSFNSKLSMRLLASNDLRRSRPPRADAGTPHQLDT